MTNTEKTNEAPKGPSDSAGRRSERARNETFRRKSRVGELDVFTVDA